MSNDVFNSMYQAIDILTARETKRSITIASYPQLNNEGRERVLDLINSQAYPNNKKELTPEEVNEKLKRRMLK